MLVGGISAPATADPEPLVPNAAGRFAINVPGSVLTAAAPDGATAAQLATADQFDWAFTDPAYAEVSGTLTAAPAVETTALTATEAATFDALVANFTAPAAAATATTVAATGGVAVVGFGLGLMIGRSAARIAGFSDSQVCLQHDAVEAALASVLDGVDCSAYQNQLTAIQRDADQVPVTSIAPITLDGVTMTYVHGDPWPGLAYNLLTCFNVTGARPPGTRLSVDVTGAAGSSNSTGSYEANTYCGSDSNLSGWWVKAPMLTAQLSVYGPGIYDTSAVVSGTVTVPDPGRQFQCVIHTFEGGTYTALSSTFKESDAQLAGIVCPSIGAGETPQNYQITEIGGGTSHVLLNKPVTGAFATWSANFPECRNGSCLLDLRHNNQSCFLTPDASACDGWINNQSNYGCYEGTHLVDLSECYVYVPAFSAAHIASGAAYADPATGDILTTQTSPTEVDDLTLYCYRLSTRVTTLNYAPSVDLGDEARRAATACLAATHLAGAVATLALCKGAVYFPGHDVQEAARNDAAGIVRNPPWAQLQYLGNAEVNRPTRDWYNHPAPGICNVGKVTGVTSCDEYPYWASAEGGPGTPTPEVKQIDALQNSREGSQWYSFGSVCGLDKGGDGSENGHALVVPMTADTDPDSMAFCIP